MVRKEELKLKGIFLLHGGHRSAREQVLCSDLYNAEEIWKSEQSVGEVYSQEKFAKMFISVL